jgi:catechol 2,3-dioxygenase-like lactoylglutathione lyase family enzyme
MNTRIDRRTLLLSLPALILARRAMGQAPPPIRMVKLNHFILNVSDVRRSTDFYQGLFGMPIQARRDQTVHLRIGAGPQFLALTPAGNRPTGIATHVGVTVQGFEASRILQTLTERKIKVEVRMTGNTTEILMEDPDGIVVQLQDVSYCGGTGPLGSSCTVEPSPKPGLLAVKELSHFTIGAGSAERSNAFYQDLFGLQVQARQGPNAPLLGVGDKIQFLMFTGGGGGRGGAVPRPASVNHVCLNMDGFNVDSILKTLETYGIKPRGNAQGAAGPLVHYVSMRMPNRGGAEGGTPELYFTDPDGLLIQLQDSTYCGGGGYLGNLCS